VVRKTEHVNMLRMVHMVNPDFFPNEIVNTIRPNPRMLGNIKAEEAKEIEALWDTSLRDEKESITFELFGHMDGVQFNNSGSMRSIKPILNKIAAVRNSEKRYVFPSSMPVFLTGISQTKGDPMDDVLEDLVQDLKELSSDTNPPIGAIMCEVKCMICDAPQRGDCKGIVRWNGTKGCERCTQSGIHRNGRMLFLKLDAELRVMENWPLYGPPENPRDQPQV
jgi:hypothetical protein